MQLSEVTFDILANFSTINPGLVFEPGNQLATISPGRHILARATIKETIPLKFAIYDLKELLNMLSMRENFEIVCKEDHLQITSGVGRDGRYVYSPSEHIQGYDAQKGVPTINLPSEEIKFDLSDEVLAEMLKAGLTLKLPHICVIGDGKTQSLRVENAANDTSNFYKYELGPTTHTFKMIFSLDHWRFLPRNYEVTISSKMVSRFVASDVTYFIAAETGSNFA